jgi:hypothetical protein
MAPVAATIVSMPVTPLAAKGANVANSACVLVGPIVNASGETLNGDAAPLDAATSVTLAGALPSLRTLKY